MEYIGEYIRSLREAKNYSQRKLGYLSKVSNATINRIEKNISKPAPETLKKLAGPLGVSYEELLYIAGYLEKGLVNADSVRKIREKRNMSFEELSKDIEHATGTKIPPETLEGMEKGKMINPEPTYINAIAKYEGVNPKVFYKGEIHTDLEFTIKENIGKLKETLNQMSLSHITDKELKEWVNNPDSLQYLIFAKKLFDMKINPDFVLKEFIYKIFRNGIE
ncbi:MAG: helix-turn-helix domain-containing protein [Firmicutes bacterium]|nr:helix-turn-helix domain-containing protein [Bacillota bacterium]